MVQHSVTKSSRARCIADGFAAAASVGPGYRTALPRKRISCAAGVTHGWKTDGRAEPSSRGSSSRASSAPVTEHPNAATGEQVRALRPSRRVCRPPICSSPSVPPNPNDPTNQDEGDAQPEQR